jgi:hypothetical protein
MRIHAAGRDKRTHNKLFAALVARLSKKWDTAPIVYLETFEAQTTLALLDQKVDVSRLIPVNWDPDELEDFPKTFPGIDCQAVNIENLWNSKPGACALYFDLCGTYHPSANLNPGKCITQFCRQATDDCVLAITICLRIARNVPCSTYKEVRDFAKKDIVKRSKKENYKATLLHENRYKKNMLFLAFYMRKV